jgi:hypothetical protein
VSKSPRGDACIEVSVVGFKLVDHCEEGWCGDFYEGADQVESGANAIAPDGGLRLRESDEPGVVPVATRTAVSALFEPIKVGGRARTRSE